VDQLQPQINQVVSRKSEKTAAKKQKLKVDAAEPLVEVVETKQVPTKEDHLEKLLCDVAVTLPARASKRLSVF